MVFRKNQLAADIANPAVSSHERSVAGTPQLPFKRPLHSETSQSAYANNSAKSASALQVEIPYIIVVSHGYNPGWLFVLPMRFILKNERFKLASRNPS